MSVLKVSVLERVDCKCKGHMRDCHSCIVYNNINYYVAAVIEEVSSKPFGADPQVMMSIVKGLYSLKPGDVQIINELLTIILYNISERWFLATALSSVVRILDSCCSRNTTEKCL